ncbi:hypothetical protein A7U60_g2503 [Sanghuangporus baumii]|uniref:Uncharacterized protein n=1 Tax=Sanghuangporus baumii TaxID=108892 RepID=A0A9Q5N823_SANBA|nr:hypothetical protein A7U60_g2503 [Sanghuangporus baumii]
MVQPSEGEAHLFDTLVLRYCNIWAGSFKAPIGFVVRPACESMELTLNLVIHVKTQLGTCFSPSQELLPDLAVIANGPFGVFKINIKVTHGHGEDGVAVVPTAGSLLHDDTFRNDE